MSPTTRAGELRVGRGMSMSWSSVVATCPSGFGAGAVAPQCAVLSWMCVSELRFLLSKGPLPAPLAPPASSLPGTAACCIRGSAGSGVAAELLCSALRYTMVAQELVVRSRGVLKERGWRLANDKLGSGDDISVFVIPLGGPGNYT